MENQGFFSTSTAQMGVPWTGLHCRAMRVARNITLGPIYDEETCLKQKCHPPTQDNLDEPTFTTFPYTT